MTSQVRAPSAGLGSLRVPRTRWDCLLERAAARPRRGDAIWAGLHALLMAMLASRELAMGATSTGRLSLFVAGAVFGSVALALRSVAPIAVLGAALVLQVVADLIDVGGPFQVTVCIALYAVVVRYGLSVALAATVASAAAGAVGVLDSSRGSSFPVVNYLFAGWFPLLATVVLALVIRSRRQDLARRDAALRAAVGALQDDAERQNLQERSCVADDLHDSVGHSMTAVIALAAGGIRSLPAHPEEALEALQTIESTARGCLGQTRDVVDRLHRPWISADDRPLDDIERVVETVRAAGLEVEVATHGDGGGGAPVENVCFHVVQEGLTNVLRHARGVQQVTVVISHRAHETQVEVRDDGEPSSFTGLSERRGLAGLARRVAELGGRFSAAPLPGRGWRTAATVPWQAPA